MMIAVWRALLGAASVLAASCVSASSPGLELDVGRRCDDIGLELADPDVLPGWTVHAAAIPRSGEDATWYLATDPKSRHWLRRVPEDIPSIELTASGDPADFQLQPGPVEGQVWLALDRDERAEVWRVDEASAEVRASAALEFPASEGEWTRRVVFLGSTPHLVAVPRSSRVGEVAVHIAALSPELGLGARWELTATVQCAPLSELSCPLFWEDLRDVSILDVAEAGSISGAALLLAIQTPPPSGPPSTDMPFIYETHILSVVLQSDLSAERPVLTRRDHVAWPSGGLVFPAPAQIAADPLGLYVIAGLVPGPDTSSADATSSDYLFRADLLGAGTGEAGDVIALLPRTLGSHLLQLGGRVALGQIVGETWHVAPIEGAEIREDTLGSLRVGEGAEVLRAGRGQMIVVGDERPNKRARVTCEEAASM